MNKEAFDAIRKDIVAAQDAEGEVVFMRPDCEPDNVYYLVRRGLQPERRVAHRYRDDKLGSVADVISVCDESLTAGKKTVWVNETSIVVYYSDADEARTIDRAYYELVLSPEFSALTELAMRWSQKYEKGLSQKDFLHLIKTKFWEAFITTADREKLIRTLSRLVKSGTMEVGNGKSATFVDVRAAAILDQTSEPTPTQDLPNEVQLACDVFIERDVATRSYVTCILDISPDATEFKLIPIASHLIRAKQEAVFDLKLYLRDELPKSVVVLSGCP